MVRREAVGDSTQQQRQASHRCPASLLKASVGHVCCLRKPPAGQSSMNMMHMEDSSHGWVVTCHVYHSLKSAVTRVGVGMQQADVPMLSLPAVASVKQKNLSCLSGMGNLFLPMMCSLKGALGRFVGAIIIKKRWISFTEVG